MPGLEGKKAEVGVRAGTGGVTLGQDGEVVVRVGRRGGVERKRRRASGGGEGMLAS